MALKTFVEDINAVDEGVRSFYVEHAEGGYVLDAEPVNGWGVENTEGLKGALTKERKLRSDFEKAAKSYKEKFEGIDPDAAREAFTKLEEFANFNPQTEAEKIAQEKYEANKKRLETSAVKPWEQKWENEYKPLENKYNAVFKQLQEQMVDNTALKAIADAKGDVDLLMPHVVRNVRFDVNDQGKYQTSVVDRSGEIMYNNKGIEMSVSEYVESLKSKFPAAFKSDVPAGGGANSQHSTAPTTDVSFMEALMAAVPGQKLV